MTPTADDIAAEIKALVRELEWVGFDDPEMRGGSTANASSVLGNYQVWGDGFWSGPHHESHRPAGDLKAGIAAAQADYTRRILSAIDLSAYEAQAEETARLRALVVEATWQDISTAPKDGTAFLCRYLPYGRAHLAMRRVRWVQDEGPDGGVILEDLGAWIIIDGIDDDYNERRPTSGEPSWSIAPDKANRTDTWFWRPLPTPPTAGGE